MFDSTALKLFGKLVSPYTEYFEGLKYSMRRARMNVSVQQYMANIVFYSFVTFIVSVIVSTTMISLIAAAFSSLLINKIAYAYTLGIIVSFLSTGLAFVVGYYWPSMKAKTISSQIDKSLPFAVSYMATTASSGTNPVNLFKMLSLRGGEIGKESNKIYTNVTSLGMSLTSALQRAALRSPSPSFADLLWGMISIITTGGDMESYLRNRTKAYMSQYRRVLNEYAKQITLYTEVYITLVIVGSLFFIVLISVMSSMPGSGGAGTLAIQTLLVFFVIPMVSIGFIVLLKAMSPEE